MTLTWNSINKKLVTGLSSLSFGPPVLHVYNPLEYGINAYNQYLERFGSGTKRVIFLGMNPGPWGMVQTGIPFGEVAAVKEWLGIAQGVNPPARMHVRRPVEGFLCNRSEVSGRRLWGWAKERFTTPEEFFHDFFVANYCPLAFMEESGKNRTPDKLPRVERERLFSQCDQALRETVALLKPAWVIGVGKFAMEQATRALHGERIAIGSIAHPSPANPQANKGWAPLVDRQLAKLGILDGETRQTEEVLRFF
ncbi:single-stranded DNA-binding protein [Myxococcota bacterium]|nr:single-stranded DNA-binding protein [Myxococcota bacterium]MBU1536562.1 single-stranded DNA-binding protein [Myxococcota bacterium]